MITVQKPSGKNYMLVFMQSELPWIFACNNACSKVLETAGLRPFHQIGTENEPGFHGWEVWGRPDLQTMRSLALTAQALAEVYYEEWWSP